MCKENYNANNLYYENKDETGNVPFTLQLGILFFEIITNFKTYRRTAD